MNEGRGILSWRRCAGWLALFNLLYLVAVSLALVLLDPLSEIRIKILSWPLDGEGSHWTKSMAAWDGAYYLKLFNGGYYKGNHSCAFYPLWPTCIHWGEKLFSGAPVITGLILNIIFSAAGWTLFYQIVRSRWNERVARYSLLALVCYPGALFFHFIYSEALFFLLVMGVWWGLERRHPGVTFVCAILAPLTRGVGLFLVLPLAWYWIQLRSWGWLDRVPWPKWWRKERAIAQEKSAINVSNTKNCKTLEYLLPLAPVLGWGSYLLMMQWWTGNYWEGVAAQKYWGNAHSISHLWDFPKFAVQLFSPTEWHEIGGSFLDRCIFILLLYSMILILRKGKDLFLWAYCLGVMPAMSGMFVSLTRFAAVCFPLFIALGMVMGAIESRKWRYFIPGLFVMLQVVLVWRFVRFEWAG